MPPCLLKSRLHRGLHGAAPAARTSSSPPNLALALAHDRRRTAGHRCRPDDSVSKQPLPEDLAGSMVLSPPKSCCALSFPEYEVLGSAIFAHRMTNTPIAVLSQPLRAASIALPAGHQTQNMSPKTTHPEVRPRLQSVRLPHFTVDIRPGFHVRSSRRIRWYLSRYGSRSAPWPSPLSSQS